MGKVFPKKGAGSICCHCWSCCFQPSRLHRGSRSADLLISTLHPALAPFSPQAFTFDTAEIIFACAAEQLETAMLISPTDQS